MRWTKARSTWLGTDLERRGRWHGVPFVIRGFSARGTTARGWVVLVVAALLLLAVLLAKELLL
jgi:hypothetical protein